MHFLDPGRPCRTGVPLYIDQEGKGSFELHLPIVRVHDEEIWELNFALLYRCEGSDPFTYSRHSLYISLHDLEATLRKFVSDPEHFLYSKFGYKVPNTTKRTSLVENKATKNGNLLKGVKLDDL